MMSSMQGRAVKISPNGTKISPVRSASCHQLVAPWLLLNMAALMTSGHGSDHLSEIWGRSDYIQRSYINFLLHICLELLVPVNGAAAMLVVQRG